MVGQNELTLCHDEMVAAVQYYLNNVLMKVPVEVLSVERINAVSGNNQFRIRLEKLKKEEEKPNP